MTARAMWKGVLRLADARVPVKLYSAVEDRDIHFRLLHAKDLTPVAQVFVDPSSDKVVPYKEIRRGYPAAEGDLVILQSDELEKLLPAESRDIELGPFVPASAIDPQWYDRPYYLGPDGSDKSYYALTTALTRGDLEGVAHWVMRKKAYVGALRARDGNLVLVTLRHAGDVVPLDSLELPSGPALDQKELDMAKQLMGMLEADFEPSEYRDEYRDQVLALIDSKKRGKKPKLKVVAPKTGTDNLTAALSASLRAHRPVAAGHKSKATSKRNPSEKSRATANSASA